MLPRLLANLAIAICALASAAVASAQLATPPAGLPIYGFEQPSLAEIEAAQAAQGVQNPTGVQAPPSSPTSDVPAIVPVEAPQRADYEKNEQSRMFGAQLFTGAFANAAPVAFNAEYAIAVGDAVNVRLWGGFTYEAALTVDPQGNIFLPSVGPVRLLGVRNAQLQARVEQAVRGSFRSNVFVYASLAAAQPVRVYVGGFVNRPGAYAGTSMDSVLHYLDQAGGVDPDRGSYLDIEVKRGSQLRARVDLYRFLLAGELPQVQFADGDVIFVNPRRKTADVSGLAENARIFEFQGESLTLAQLGALAKPKPEATHVRVTRSAGTVRDVEYYPLAAAQSVFLLDGDKIAFTADKRPGTITVRVEGEHEGAQEFVLPYGSRLGDVMAQVAFSERSAADDIQLFRESIKQRQKLALETTLRSLESAALTARSGTAEEAVLRREEAALLLQFVDRARKIEPIGQVAIARAQGRDGLLLEHGDVIRVPSRDGLVLVTGEVLFPNAVAHDPALGLAQYIDSAGGYTNNANSSRIVIAHRDGSYSQAKGSSKAAIVSGDQIMVLPRIDSKNRQILKELTQILYQIAVSAHVVLDF